VNHDQVGGLRLGRYQVIKPIGEGGMAQVYLAVRLGAGGFEKPVVLKVLHSRFLANTSVVDMFLEEARLLARLRHPNIVDVFEVECVGGVPYLAMELVSGPTLGDLQRFVGRPGRDTVGFFLLLIQQVCRALHHAHTLTVDGKPAGVVHRDVSSQNILVDATTGAAKLIDFGIAKAADTEKHTDVGILKGKIHYMAPEVMRGNRPDARADVYSVGVLLYRILLGRNPFRESDLLRKDRPEPYVPYSTLNDPPGVAAIVGRAMSPTWEDRYPTAEALAIDLQEVLDPLDVHPDQIAPFLARVFPRGEEDWRPRATGTATGGGHAALAHLASESASLVGLAPSASRRDRTLSWFAAGTGALTAVVLLLVVAVLASDFAARSGHSAEANALLDLADQMLEADDPDAARAANEKAAGMDVDPVTAARAKQQRTAIDRAARLRDGGG
jgi:serine/threonine-protein kinase